MAPDSNLGELSPPAAEGRAEMPIVKLNDDAPLGPNDFRFEIDDDAFERFRAVAAEKAQPWEDLLIQVILSKTESATPTADAALGAAQPTAIKDAT
jgi:hypothetical protein